MCPVCVGWGLVWSSPQGAATILPLCLGVVMCWGAIMLTALATVLESITLIGGTAWFLFVVVLFVGLWWEHYGQYCEFVDDYRELKRQRLLREEESRDGGSQR